jgi:acyl carrier protein
MTNQRLRLLIAEMLDLRESDITAETSRAQTESWDSLNHLQLITAVESRFGITLGMDEIAAIQTVGDLERAVEARAPGGVSA